ncbi:hypothetical protein J2T16_000888 [Paenibacillus intestini]|nr:hypothetical protein [Paenibacillus intestini]
MFLPPPKLSLNKLTSSNLISNKLTSNKLTSNKLTSNKRIPNIFSIAHKIRIASFSYKIQRSALQVTAHLQDTPKFYSRHI